jgi:hypothetical protein
VTHRVSGSDRVTPRHPRAGGRRSRTPVLRRAKYRGGWTAGIVLAAAALFLCYLRVSRGTAVGSDGGSISLQAWDMLHGNVLLHGWTTSDVSFYPAELVQYVLIEAVRGLGPDVVHIAGAMTYTLLVLLAAWLAKGRATGRKGLIRAAVAVVIMLAPAPGAGPTLLLSPDHFGSAVPVLLAWLAVDRLPARGPRWARWGTPVIVALVLAWGQLADGLVLVTGVIPMVIVCGLRAGVKAWPAAHRVRGSSLPWAEVSLAAAAIVSAGLARAAGALIRLSGGFALQPVATTFAGLATLPHHLKLTAEGLLAIFGADFFSGPLSRPALAFAVLHLIGVAAVAVAFLVALGRLGRGDELAVPGLAVAIVFNIAAYVPSLFVQDLRSTREISAVLPFAAVLAGRLLGDRMLDGPLLRFRLTAALAVLGLVFAAALGYGAAQPGQPAQNQSLAAWLAARHLSGGLSVDYGVANSTTLDSGGRITVRQIALSNGALARPTPRETKASWYDPAHEYADFIVASDARPGDWSGEWAAAVRAFGPPARVLHPAGYTVLFWPRNLLTGLR